MKIVCEIGLLHEGSLGTALRVVDACADAGADAVKFQCHLGDPVSEFRRGTWFPQDATRQDYWQRTAFTPREWEDVRDHCRAHQIEFGVSCFSMEAFALMQSIGVGFWKIGSAQLTNEELMLSVWGTGQPVVMSTGMSSYAEIGKALSTGDFIDRVTLLQCTSSYRCKASKIGLNLIEEYRKRFGCKVGLSDHSGTVWPGIIAAYLGADMLEVHVCKSRWDFGPDVAASLRIEQLALLVRGVRYVKQMKPVDKDAVAAEMEEMRRIFRGN